MLALLKAHVQADENIGEPEHLYETLHLEAQCHPQTIVAVALFFTHSYCQPPTSSTFLHVKPLQHAFPPCVAPGSHESRSLEQGMSTLAHFFSLHCIKYPA